MDTLALIKRFFGRKSVKLVLYREVFCPDDFIPRTVPVLCILCSCAQTMDTSFGLRSSNSFILKWSHVYCYSCSGSEQVTHLKGLRLQFVLAKWLVANSTCTCACDVWKPCWFSGHETSTTYVCVELHLRITLRITLQWLGMYTVGLHLCIQTSLL